MKWIHGLALKQTISVVLLNNLSLKGKTGPQPVGVYKNRHYFKEK